MDKILVTILGSAVIIFIYWFFFKKKEEVVSSSQGVEVVVNGGYTPSVIKLKKNTENKISILRKDSSSCLEEIVIPDFKIKEFLPIGKSVDIIINPKTSGEFTFQCGMGMFHGKIIVE